MTKKPKNYSNSTKSLPQVKEFKFVGYHSRSKFGCLVCRDKKVKCDEARPSCGRCLKMNINCEYKSHDTKKIFDMLHFKMLIPPEPRRSEGNQASIKDNSKKEEGNPSVDCSSHSSEPCEAVQVTDDQEQEEQDDDNDAVFTSQEVIITSIPAAGTRTAFARVLKMPYKNGILDTSILQNSTNNLDKLDLGLDDNTPVSLFIDNMRKFLNNTSVIKEATNKLITGSDEKGSFQSPKNVKDLNAFLKSVFSGLQSNEVELLEISCIESRKLFISTESWDYFIKLILQLATQSELLLHSMLFWGNIAKEKGAFKDEVSEYRRIIEGIVSRSEDKKFLLASCFVLSSTFISSGHNLSKTHECLELSTVIIKETNMIAAIDQLASNEVWMLANLAYQSLFDLRTHAHASYFDTEIICTIFKNKALDEIPFQGCLRSLLPLISDIVIFGQKATNVYSLLSHKEKINNYAYTEKFNGMVHESVDIDSKTYRAHPIKRDFIHIRVEDIELHLSIYEMYQFAITLYSKTNVRKIPSIVPEVQVLVAKIINLIQFLVNCPLSNSFSFPILIAGMNCVYPNDRNLFMRILEQHKKAHRSIPVVEKIEKIILQSWLENPHGLLSPEWFSLAQNMNISINLA